MSNDIKDIIIAVGGFAVTTIQLNSQDPDLTAVLLANLCMLIDLYATTTEEP